MSARDDPQAFVKLMTQYRKAAIAAVDDATQVIAESIRSRAPRDTGQLANEGIKVRKPRSRNNKIIGVVSINDGHPDRQFLGSIEYGNADRPADPFIRNGFDTVEGEQAAKVLERIEGAV